jgi:hypothetical protein
MTNFYEFQHLHEPQSTARRAHARCVASLEQYPVAGSMSRCSEPARHNTSLSSQHPTRQQEEEKQVRGEVRRRRSESEESRIALQSDLFVCKSDSLERFSPRTESPKSVRSRGGGMARGRWCGSVSPGTNHSEAT